MTSDEDMNGYNTFKEINEIYELPSIMRSFYVSILYFYLSSPFKFTKFIRLLCRWSANVSKNAIT